MVPMDEFREKIDAKIDAITNSITDLKLSQGRIVSHLESESATHSRMEHRIMTEIKDCANWRNGNGRPGAKTRLTLLEKRIGGVMWLLGVVIVAFVGAGIRYIFTQ